MYFRMIFWKSWISLENMKILLSKQLRWLGMVPMVKYMMSFSIKSLKTSIFLLPRTSLC